MSREEVVSEHLHLRNPLKICEPVFGGEVVLQANMADAREKIILMKKTPCIVNNGENKNKVTAADNLVKEP